MTDKAVKPRLRFALVAGGIVLATGLGLAAIIGLQRLDSPGPLEAETRVIVPRGATLGAIALRLEEQGVIRDSLSFKVAGRLLGAARGLKAGEYAFPPKISLREALGILKEGNTVVRRLTIAEGLTSTEIVALVAAAEGLAGETGPVPPEGSLLPETYHYSWDDERAALVARMSEGLKQALAELWPKRAESLPIKSPEEAVILASIVEKETGVPEERPLVASVFVNRLRRGMRLQSDPTVVYALTQGNGPLGRALIFKDLEIDSPYNTYRYAGLPPGPIANVGRAALEAVLNPAQSSYLYFVADGTGGHAFAKSLSEHNKNVAKWRKIQRQQRKNN